MYKITLAALVVGAVLVAQQRTVWDGVYTEAQAERGQKLYTTNCASCHGDDLAGRMVDAQQKAHNSPPLVGNSFLQDWNGLPLADLFERTRISMPQQAPGSLSAQQNADLLAYLLQKNSMPAGDSELPPRGELLKQITFVTAKP